MYLADTHTHTFFSFDGHQTIDELCESAAKKGISAIAVTEHYDADGIIEGYYPPYFADKSRDAVYEARDKYKGKLKISHGIELAQPYTYPKECSALISDYKFDYVIGSLHNLVKFPDFCFLNYEKMPQLLMETFWERSLDEIYSLLLQYEGCRIHTLAHLTYPVRYMKRAGRDVDMKRFYPKIELIYKRLIEKGIALEVNTSGLRQGAEMTFPDNNLIWLYRECGGELITVGSDAHFAKDVGADIEATYKLLHEFGFRYTIYYGADGAEMIPLR